MIQIGEEITVASQIVDTTASIVFNNEAIILTEINIKSYGHRIDKCKLHEEDGYVWQISYLEDDEYFQNHRTRNVLFEKFKKIYGYFRWHYDFYEPVEIIGKGNEVSGYEELFSIIKNAGGIYEPEKTLILKRK